MALDELPDAERTCKRCEHDDDGVQATCGGCSRAWSGGHIEGALNDYWSEHGRSVRERAEKHIAELEALVPHPGDGSCDRCGVVLATHVPMSLCPECAEKDAEKDAALVEIARLQANCLDAVAREGRAVARSGALARALTNMAKAAIDVVGIRNGRGVPQPDNGNYETIRQMYSEAMRALKGGA